MDSNEMISLLSQILDEKIGMVTAYAYAKSKGYSGSADDFANDMANIGVNISAIETAINTFNNETVPNAETAITTAGSNQVTAVNTAGQEQLQNVTAEGGRQVGLVTAAGTAQTEAVNNAGTTQTNAVNTAGSTQVSNVNNAGSQQIAAIQTKGEEVLASIPSDYTDLSNEVTDLKSALFEDEITTVTATKNVYEGTAISAATHIIDANVSQGAKFTWKIDAPNDGIASYTLYADGTAIYASIPVGVTVEIIAQSDITYFSIYVGKTGVVANDTLTATLSYQSKINANSFEEKIGENADGVVRSGFFIDYGKDRKTLKEYPGFVGGTGAYSNQTYTNKEVLTDKIPVSVGEVYYIDYTVPDTTKTLWLSLCTYDSSDTFKVRYTLISSGTGTYHGQYTVTAGVAKICLTYRTYGNCTVDLYKVPQWILDLNAEINTIEGRTYLPNTVVKSIAHRGDDIEAPQCTAHAYIAARKHGHTIAENDWWHSEDGEFVCWHDINLSRLGDLVDINGYLMYTDGTNYYWVKNSTVYTWDGSDYVESAVALSGLTRCAGADYGVCSDYGAIGLPFAVLRRIDFGVYKGAQFAGTQILTFAEWVMLCKQLGMEIYIDKKFGPTDAQLTSAANIVKAYGMGNHASWLALTKGQITLVRTIIPDARCGLLTHPTAELIAEYQSYNTGRGFFFNGNAKEGMTESVIQSGLNAGYDVEVWYVDYGALTEEQILSTIRTAVSYGVTSITLDHYRADEAFAYLLE